MRLLLVGLDEGTLVSGAVRVSQGQVFARDFFEVMGPGTFYWLALFFKLFGVTFIAARVCLFITSLGSALVIYYLSRQICHEYRWLPCLLVFGLCFAAAWPGISHHTDSNFAAFLSMACLALWQNRRNGSLLLAAGALAALTTSIHSPKGLLLLVSIGLWIVIVHRDRSALVSVGKIMAGFCSVVALILVYFWSQGALGDLMYANFIWPSAHYGAVNSVPYAQGIIKFCWNRWAVTKGTFDLSHGIASILILPFLLVATLPAILLILGARKKWRSIRPKVLLCFLCGCALWLSEYHRRDIYHLVLGAPLLIVLCVHLLGECRGRIAKLSLQILAISTICLAGSNWLLAVFATHPVATQAGSVAMFKPDAAISFLHDHASPGEEIFAYPYCPMYYFVSGTKNPTRYSILVYNYNTPSQFQDVVQLLERRRIRYVIWNTNFNTVVGTVFPAAARIRPDELIIEPYLESHYTPIKVEDGIRIMERKNQNAE